MGLRNFILFSKILISEANWLAEIPVSNHARLLAKREEFVSCVIYVFTRIIMPPSVGKDDTNTLNVPANNISNFQSLTKYSPILKGMWKDMMEGPM